MSKNTRNRILLTAVAALLLVVMTVGGTLAWLQDVTEPVENVFTTTNVDIDLNESDNLNLEVVPGQDITKDPQVTVIKGSEHCWVFVKVVMTEDFEKYLGTTQENGSYKVEFDSNWTELSSTVATDGVKTVILYKEVEEIAHTGNDLVIKVLKDNKIKVSDKLTNTDMDNLELTDPKLTVTAYAIQYAGNENVNTAWTNVQNAAKYKTGNAMDEGTIVETSTDEGDATT